MPRIDYFAQLRDTASAGLSRLSFRLSALAVVGNQIVQLFRTMTQAVARLGRAFVDLAKRTGDVANVKTAFRNIVGNTETALIELRAAAQGLISDFDLMVNFNRAITLGSARNAEEFAKLTKTALTLGRALGVDAAFALESLNLGIGRQSRLILDNLGLVVKVEAANQAYARQLNTTVSKLSDTQKRQAFLNATFAAAEAKIRELGGVTIRAADHVTRIGTAFTNVKDAIGEFLSTSPAVIEFLDRIASLAEDIADAFKDPSQIVEVFKLLGIIAGNAFSAAFLSVFTKTLEGLDRLTLPKFFERDEEGRGGGIFQTMADLITGAGGELPTAIENILSATRELQARGRRGRDAAEERAAAAARPRLTEATLPGITVKAGAATTGISAEAEQLVEELKQTKKFAFDTLLDITNFEEKMFLIRLGIFQDTFIRQKKIEEEEKRRKDREDRERERQMRKREQERAHVVAVVGSMVEAVVRGSDITADSIIQMTARIVSSLPGVGPLAQSIIGVAGGILGAFTSRGRRDTVDARIKEYDTKALDQLREVRQGPDTVVVAIRASDSGELLEQFVVDARRQSDLDKIVRLPDRFRFIPGIGVVR